MPPKIQHPCNENASLSPFVTLNGSQCPEKQPATTHRRTSFADRQLTKLLAAAAFIQVQAKCLQISTRTAVRNRIADFAPQNRQRGCTHGVAVSLHYRIAGNSLFDDLVARELLPMAAQRFCGKFLHPADFRCVHGQPLRRTVPLPCATSSATIAASLPSC